MGVMLPILDPKSSKPALALIAGRRFERDTASQLPAGCNLRAALNTFLGSDSPEKAVQLLAHALPKQYALLWACDCLKKWLTTQTVDHSAEYAGLALAQGWLRDPKEENRRSALDYAERSGFRGVGAWIAAAAGWTAGSIAPKGYDPIVPGEALSGDAMTAALLTAAAAMPAMRAKRLEEFVQQAIATFGAEEAR